MPPSYLVKSSPPQPRASSLIRSAWATAVWSFHRTNIASGSDASSGLSASGVPVSSARQGVEPVVSMVMPRTLAAAAAPASARARLVASSIPST
jgi:hypothetical protein